MYVWDRLVNKSAQSAFVKPRQLVWSFQQAPFMWTQWAKLLHWHCYISHLGKQLKINVHKLAWEFERCYRKTLTFATTVWNSCGMFLGSRRMLGNQHRNFICLRNLPRNFTWSEEMWQGISLYSNCLSRIHTQHQRATTFVCCTKATCGKRTLGAIFAKTVSLPVSVSI